MTTTLPVPSSTPTAPTGAAAGAAAAPVCALEVRAARAAARDLGAALTGIAFDAHCGPERQRAIVRFAAGVLPVVGALAARAGDRDLAAACQDAEDAGRRFAQCISSGAPGAARAWITLSERLARRPAGAAHADLGGCAHGVGSVPAPLVFAVPWFLDVCSPRERVDLLDAAPRRVRLALRLGEDRWLRLRDAVRG